MKIESFRELLLKKAEGDPNLETLIQFMDSEILADKALESLEKMARAAHKGDAANFAVRDFGLEMDPEMEPHMLRDALGHHISKYKAAVKSGRQDLANQHAKQAFRLMNLANTAQKHSHGKLHVDFVDPKPWERNHPTLRRTFKDVMDETGEIPEPVKRGNKKLDNFVTDTKGLNYRGNDFSFLQGAPHESYGREVKKHGHNGAYPFENIRVNGKYIHVDDDVPLNGFEKHPFDYHPIVAHFDDPAKKRGPEKDKQYLEEKQKYYDESPHIGNFFDRHEQLQSANPETYSQRGTKASEPVHAPVAEPLAIEGQAAAAPKAAAPKAEAKAPEIDTNAIGKDLMAQLQAAGPLDLGPKKEDK